MTDKREYKRRVVCAANKHESTGFIICGASHYDSIMHKQIEQLGLLKQPMIQGFIDQHGIFMTREEAYEVAYINGQILAKTGDPEMPVLYSEDIY
jgi:hypothetical protein